MKHWNVESFWNLVYWSHVTLEGWYALRITGSKQMICKGFESIIITHYPQSWLKTVLRSHVSVIYESDNHILHPNSLWIELLCEWTRSCVMRLFMCVFSDLQTGSDTDTVFLPSVLWSTRFSCVWRINRSDSCRCDQSVIMNVTIFFIYFHPCNWIRSSLSRKQRKLINDSTQVLYFGCSVNATDLHLLFNNTCSENTTQHWVKYGQTQRLGTSG